MTAFPVHGEPQLSEPAKLHALHVRDIDLAAQGISGHVTLAGDRKYFLTTQSKGKKDGDLFEMDRWFLDVPAGMAGPIRSRAASRYGSSSSGRSC